MKKYICLISILLFSCTSQQLNTSSNTKDNTPSFNITTKENTKKVSGVFIIPDELNINIREKTKIYGNVKYEDKSIDKDFNLSVSGDSIDIDKEGNITPLKQGKSTITLTSNKDKSISKTSTVNVIPIGSVLVRENNNIRDYSIHANRNEEIVVSWTEINTSDLSLDIFVQKFDKLLLPITEVKKVGTIENIRSIYEKVPIKCLINDNGDYIISYLSGYKINIHKFSGNKSEKIIIDEGNFINNYYIDISNDYIGVIWDINHSGFYHKIYTKVFKFDNTILIDKTQLNSNIDEGNSSYPRIKIKDKIISSYYSNDKTISNNFNQDGKLIEKKISQGYTFKDVETSLYSVNDMTFLIFQSSDQKQLYIKKLDSLGNPF